MHSSGSKSSAIAVLAALTLLGLLTSSAPATAFESDLWPGEGRPVCEAATAELTLHERPSASSRKVQPLLVESGQRPPKDYYESFTQLAKVGALSAAFATRIAACAGLRNRLVHEYDDIDPERMHEAASTALKDVPDYLRLVRRFADGA